MDESRISETVGQMIERKLDGWDKVRAYLIIVSFSLAGTGVFVGIMIGFMVLKQNSNFVPALTASATYRDYVIIRAACNGGSWLAYIGVLYDTRTPNYGILAYYPMSRCDHSLSNMQTVLQAETPINGSLIVWFYPNRLPETYVHDPYVPFTSTDAFVFLMVMVGLVAQLFIVIPVNIFLVKFRGHKSVGPIACCCACCSCIG